MISIIAIVWAICVPQFLGRRLAISKNLQVPPTLLQPRGEPLVSDTISSARLQDYHVFRRLMSRRGNIPTKKGADNVPFAWH